MFKFLVYFPSSSIGTLISIIQQLTRTVLWGSPFFPIFSGQLLRILLLDGSAPPSRQCSQSGECSLHHRRTRHTFWSEIREKKKLECINNSSCSFLHPLIKVLFVQKNISFYSYVVTHSGNDIKDSEHLNSLEINCSG